MGTRTHPNDIVAIANIRKLLGAYDPAPAGELSPAEQLRAAQALQRVKQLRVGGPRRQAPGYGTAAAVRPRHAPLRLRHAPLRLRHGPRRAKVAFASSAAGLVAAASVIALQLGGGNPASATPALPAPLNFRHGGHAAAVSFLYHEAALEAVLPARSASSTTYTKTQNYALNVDVGADLSTTYVVTTLQQVWVGPGCAASEVSQSQETNAATGAPVGSPGPESADPHWLDTSCRLPTSLRSLETAISGSAVGAGDYDYSLADGVMDQLSLGTASPAQVSVLYEALASLPGVFDAGTVTDDAGRVGRAVGVQAGTVNSPSSLVGAQVNVPQGCAGAVPGRGFDYFVIDPLSGAPMEVEEINTTPPCALRLPSAPTVQQYDVIVASSYVDKAGDTPK